jgi:adenylate cyclase
MWNAPTEVPQHADRAVQAALAMTNELPGINSQWAERLGGIIRLGVGIHTGRAQVGNSGSRRRLKYGPRGHAVNLTSRVEAATKVFGISCLMTAATRQQLKGDFPLRRVCKARLTGMTEANNLFELSGAGSQPTWPLIRTRYEAALGQYEANQLAECKQACQDILEEFGEGDAPTKWLLAQAELRLSTPNVPWDPVFSVETK